MRCYFQGCTEDGETNEHIPPKSFFPDGEKEQLLTVKSCKKHNNSKSKDDLYVLAHICINASPSNRAREVFLNKVAPQLKHNNGAFGKRLAKGAERLPDGTVRYNIEISRIDDFFTALSCGIIFKSCGSPLPTNYKIRHIYHNFGGGDPSTRLMEDAIGAFYSGKPLDFMEFGNAGTKNEKIYTVELFGMPEFQTSITIVHLFFGTFKVTSMLTNQLDQPASNS